MANLTNLRNALANQIETNCLPYLAADGSPLDQVNPPIALVLPGSPLAKYGSTLGESMLTMGPDGYAIPMATTEFNLRVMVLVSHASTTDRVQDTLDVWLGFENDYVNGQQTVSVPMAVAMDPTLGGIASYCEAMTVSQYGPVEYAGIQFLGATILFNLVAQ